uniref:Terpene cyclase terS n=1 Tax=Tolypocladium album TaxID=124418 RepID=TERS_TOLAL
MSSAWQMSILQAFFALVGMTWKLKEGYPIFEVLNLPRLVESFRNEGGWQGLCTWVEVFGGISMQSLQHDWPWFSLHLFLYIGQLVPFVILVMNETLAAGAKLERTIAMLGSLSSFVGFSTAMPIISLWILHNHQQKRLSEAQHRNERLILRSVFVFSAITHVGAFLVAFTATWAPSILPSRAASALHIMNSLVGVPDSTPAGVSSSGIRQARLRQINEMTGTSSGFFMTVGLFCHALEFKSQQLTAKTMVWMFFVSLIAGPAAGGAAVLLLRNSVARESHDKD